MFSLQGRRRKKERKKNGNAVDGKGYVSYCLSWDRKGSFRPRCRIIYDSEKGNGESTGYGRLVSEENHEAVSKL